MPTLDWLRKQFHYGYDSGDVTAICSDDIRQSEEMKIGGSYKQVADELLVKYIKPSSNVLELGPGKGSWSKAIVDILETGSLTTLDFQDVSQWIHGDKVRHFQVQDIDYAFLEEEYFDFFWSFGVLCHNNIDMIYRIMQEVYPKLRKNAILIHQYADWEKLYEYGWEKGAIPVDFQKMPDNQIWWPRNNKATMQTILEGVGYEILQIDCNLVGRDSIFICKKI